MDANKLKQVNDIINRSKCFVNLLVHAGLDSAALGAVSSMANFMYEWNQEYTDSDFEVILSTISERHLRAEFTKDQADTKTILYYDSFGFDSRGLTIIYLKALCDLGYQVVYVSPEGQKQPILEKNIKGGNLIWCYVPINNNLHKANIITKLFNKWRPEKAFLYALPGDTAAITAFNAFRGIVERYQINLTDHAFWLGLNAFDYCIEFRDFGASVSYRFRNIDRSKLVLLPYYPFIDKSIPFEDFNDKFVGKKIIFSGGAVKKTLGDKELLYYKMVDKILSENEDAAFIYAGTGSDTSALDSLIAKYSSRAEHIHERKDLYQVLKHCILYLNTYPENGGLMTQYAAVAGKLPITLNGEQNDLSGLISKRDLLNIEFTDINKLVDEVNILLRDDKYRSQKESYLFNAVINEDSFKTELKNVLETHATTFKFTTDENIKLDEIRRPFYSSFNVNDQRNWAISRYKVLGWAFPISYINLCRHKIFKFFN